MSDLFAREAEQGKPADARQQYSLSKALRDFYEEQRNERTLLWQDVSKLRQTLPETAQQYLSSYRKMSVLREEEGDEK